HRLKHPRGLPDVVFNDGDRDIALAAVLEPQMQRGIAGLVGDDDKLSTAERLDLQQLSAAHGYTTQRTFDAVHYHLPTVEGQFRRQRALPASAGGGNRRRTDVALAFHLAGLGHVIGTGRRGRRWLRLRRLLQHRLRLGDGLLHCLAVSLLSTCRRQGISAQEHDGQGRGQSAGRTCGHLQSLQLPPPMMNSTPPVRRRATGRGAPRSSSLSVNPSSPNAVPSSRWRSSTRRSPALSATVRRSAWPGCSSRVMVEKPSPPSSFASSSPTRVPVASTLMSSSNGMTRVLPPSCS